MTTTAQATQQLACIHHQTVARRPLSLRRRLIFAAVPVVTLMLVMETLARCCLAPGVSGGERFEQIEQIIVYLGNARGESIFEPDPDCFWRLKPNVELPVERGSHWGGKMSNSCGLRSREVTPADVTDRRRILCFGDSTTFSFGVPFEAAWPNQLQSVLKSRSPDEFEVLNAGIPGQTTYQGRQRLRHELATWQPELTLITFGNNDGWRWDGHADKQHAEELRQANQWQWLRGSRALDWMMSSLAASRQKREEQVALEWARAASLNYFDPQLEWTPRVSLDDYSDNLRAMIAECRAHRSEPVLIVWPDQRQLLRQPTWREPYQAAMRTVANEAQVRCIDLVPVFEETGDWGIQRFIPHDVIHVDRAGNELVSQIVLRTVLALPQGFHQASSS